VGAYCGSNLVHFISWLTTSMNPMRRAMLMEPDIRFQCGEQGIRMRESFIGYQLLWQFSVGKKVYVRYWPGMESCDVAQVRVGREFDWNTVSRCQIERAVRYAIDNAYITKLWVEDWISKNSEEKSEE